MIEKNYLIQNEIGLHARPASLFVDLASKFDAKIMIAFDDIEVNAKSIISVLSLGLGKGDKFKLIIKGSDEKDAIKALEEFIEDKLQEEGNFNDVIN